MKEILMHNKNRNSKRGMLDKSGEVPETVPQPRALLCHLHPLHRQHPGSRPHELTFHDLLAYVSDRFSEACPVSPGLCLILLLHANSHREPRSVQLHTHQVQDWRVSAAGPEPVRGWGERSQVPVRGPEMRVDG